MKTPVRSFVLIALVMSLVACASGPRFSELDLNLKPDTPENGRVYFYRASSLGAAVQPTIYLNDKPVGSAVPRGFFFLDLLPGNYEAATTTEVKRTVSFLLDPGQTRYVRFNISMGFFVGHVYGELVDEKEALEELKDCSYTGDKVLNQKQAKAVK